MTNAKDAKARQMHGARFPVILDINVSKRSPQPALAVAGSANVPIATKEARTRVIVRDGGTAVIGGIYEVSTNEGQDRVPGLSNIPILGHLAPVGVDQRL